MTINWTGNQLLAEWWETPGLTIPHNRSEIDIDFVQTSYTIATGYLKKCYSFIFKTGNGVVCNYTIGTWSSKITPTSYFSAMGCFVYLPSQQLLSVLVTTLVVCSVWSYPAVAHEITIVIFLAMPSHFFCNEFLSSYIETRHIHLHFVLMQHS